MRWQCFCCPKKNTLVQNFSGGFISNMNLIWWVLMISKYFVMTTEHIKLCNKIMENISWSNHCLFSTICCGQSNLIFLESLLTSLATHNQFLQSKQPAANFTEALSVHAVLHFSYYDPLMLRLEIFTKNVSGERGLHQVVIEGWKAWGLIALPCLKRLWMACWVNGWLPRRRWRWKQSGTTHQGSCIR